MDKRTLLIVVFVVTIVGSGLIWNSGLKEEEEPFPEPTHQGESPDQVESPQTKVYGDGEILVTFIVDIPDWTPSGDKVFVQLDGYQHMSGWGIPMEEVEPSVWTVSFMAPANRLLAYKFNRNNGGYSTDEEFSPDTNEARREVKIGTKALTVQDIIQKWRWLTKEPPEARISDYIPEEVPEREQPFIVGIGLLDFYQGGFDDYVGPTLDRIAEMGFKYVGIAYAPSFFISSEPLEFTREPVNTYSVDQLKAAFEMARERDLSIMLSAGVETDPSNFDVIEDGLWREHDDDWYRELVREWEEVMVRVGGIAEAHGVEILALSNQWPFFGEPTDEQKEMLNGLVRDAIRRVNGVYSGVLTTDFHMWDEIFDYYDELDWVGDKWWWDLIEDKDAGLEEMLSRAEEIIEDIYRPIHERYDKPIFLQQLAYGSYDGAAGASQISTEGHEVAEWFPYNPDWPVDFQEQTDAYEAVFRVISDEEFFSGVFAFSYSYWDLYDKSTGIRGKPAEKVWIRWNQILIGD